MVSREKPLSNKKLLIDTIKQFQKSDANCASHLHTLSSAPSSIIDSLTRAPGPITQWLPIDTFGPNFADGSTTAVGCMKTSPVCIIININTKD